MFKTCNCLRIFAPNQDIHLLKTITIYIFILLASIAYSFETIEYFTKAVGGDATAWIKDFDCEQSDSEPENSSEEQLDLDDFYLNNKYLHQLIPVHIELGIIEAMQNDCFSSIGYGQEVYSPPEIL